MLNDSATVTTALTHEERKAVQEQLERLLSNSHFKQSRRFPSFLRFVIDQTLLGQTDLLKERTLGIEIFGREADYDTALRSHCSRDGDRDSQTHCAVLP